MNELLTLGVSHKTAPVGLRERLALTADEVPAFLRGLTGQEGVREAVALSTCNRTEVTVVAGDPVAAESAVLAVVARRAGIRPTELAEVIYSPRNCDVARHLFRVSSGLESMIVGEAEVQGQVKRAHEAALAAGTAGPLTNRLFGAALATGKRVRTETTLGEGHVSLPSVAVALAEEVLGDLPRRHVVVIGAGETSELTVGALHARGVTTMFVANRHADRARSVAERFGGAVVPFDDLPAQLERADIVLSSTGSPDPILGREDLEVVMRAREHRPLLLVDIAVPRDIDPACADLEGVTLGDVDDLQRLVERTATVRQGQARHAEDIVEEEISRFADWLGGRDALPTVAALRAHGADIVERVLVENAQRWESASERDLARVEAMARTVMSRLLHEPTIRLRSLDEEHSHGRLEIARELFGLQGDDVAADELTEDRPDNVRSLRRRASS
ncbi:MAG: glutamyl-tRNA reductase [Solirubrobacterales bacterium]|nr:glutamyl-tRNA reductase [Solirubrobacterales bacterium]